MKIAWLIWRYEDTEAPEIHFSEPFHYYFKVVQIVYAEVLQ